MTKRVLQGKILVNKPNINKEIVAEAQMLIDEDWKPNNKIIKDKKLREAMENEYARRLRLDILSTYKPALIKKYVRKKRIKLLDAGDSSYHSEKWTTITPVLHDLSWKELEKILSRLRKKTYRRKRRKRKTRKKRKRH